MYAPPVLDIARNDCTFYHVMDLPGHGQVGGEWDLRASVDDYLGHMDFRGRSVLEIGPASGFLTTEMERRGADVVALEMPESAEWDYVPFPAAMLDPIRRERIGVMRRLRNSFWFVHHVLNLRARLVYASAYDIPDALGTFDVAVLASVLLHCHSPLRVVEQCARRASSLVITDLYDPGLQGLRACQLVPTVENRTWDTWWTFSPDLFVDFLKVMGFHRFSLTTHHQQASTGTYNMFTLVAHRR